MGLPVRCRTGDAHMLLSGDLIDGLQAERWGLGQAVPESGLDNDDASLSLKSA